MSIHIYGIYSFILILINYDSNHISRSILNVDSCDTNTCIRLSVSVLTTITLLSLVLQNNNLLVLALTNTLSCYCSLACVSSLDAGIICYCQNIIKSNCCTSIALKLLSENLVADRNLILLAACLDNCVIHIVSSCSSSLAA